MKHKGLSVLIVLLVGMQASTFVTGTKVWPFMAYCMYADSYGPDHQIRGATHQWVALTAAGEELALDVYLCGLRFFPLNHHYLRPLSRGESEAGRRLARRINARRLDPVVAFRVLTTEYRLLETGVEITELSKTYPVDE